jgi:serine/threonine-protein kinase RsbW
MNPSLLQTFCQKESLQLVLSSRISLVVDAMNVMTQQLESWGVHETSRFEVVLRELLMNAICHGNRQQETRRVRCSIVMPNSESVIITVEDEGSGFDYRNLSFSLPEHPVHVGHRGYILIGNMARTISFNERGNRVRVTMDATTQNKTKTTASFVPLEGSS